jgi:signal transduction histidine kinase
MELTSTGRLVLEQVDLFATLPPQDLATIHDYLDTRTSPPGTVLFRAGDRGDCLYVIRRGVVKITQTQDCGDVVLGRREQGQMVGEMALIDSSLRRVTAVCEEETKLFVLSRTRFLEVLEKHPAIAARFLRILAAKVREMDDVILAELESKNRDLEAARDQLEQLLQRLEKANTQLEGALSYRDRVLAVSPYPVVVTDVLGRVHLINPAAIRLFGQNTASHLWEWIPPVDPSCTQEIDATLDRQAKWKGEVEVRGPDGQVLICKITAVPIKDTGEGGSARLWMFEDLTEIRQWELQAHQREQLAIKGEMAAEIAHELNNYLAVLSGNAELLSMSMQDSASERTLHRLENIGSTIDRIKVFTDNLLRTRNLAGEKTPLALNAFLENQIAFLKPQKRVKKVKIETEWDESLPMIMCDPSALQQVFYNLIINAADALGETGGQHCSVWVKTEFHPEQGHIVITVADDGPGIPEQLKSRLLKERVSSKPAGHGFGLLTSARIVREHGGTMSAQNRAEGGAEFRITLPVQLPAEGEETPKWV